MSLGDLVLVNSFMIQLYIPLNFLGVIYREIKQALADMERLFGLLDQNREVADTAGAQPLATRGARVEFSHVEFSYETKRQILFDVDFAIPAGTTTAVVGHSGSGKSTLSRLLFRFYDVNKGSISIDGQDIRQRHAGVAARGDRHRAAGYGAVQRHDRIQHRLRQAGFEQERHRRGGARGIDPRLHREPAGRVCDDGRGARPETVGRREAAGGDRAHPAEKSGDPDFRRSDVGARFEVGAGDPGAAEGDREATAPRW